MQNTVGACGRAERENEIMCQQCWIFWLLFFITSTKWKHRLSDIYITYWKMNKRNQWPAFNSIYLYSFLLFINARLGYIEYKSQITSMMNLLNVCVVFFIFSFWISRKWNWRIKCNLQKRQIKSFVREWWLVSSSPPSVLYAHLYGTDCSVATTSHWVMVFGRARLLLRTFSFLVHSD